MAFWKRLGAVFFGGAGQQFETIGEKTGALGVPVFAGTADACAGQEGTVLAKRQGALVGVVGKCDGVLGEILHHVEADGETQLVHVVGVVGGFSGGAAFENEDGERSAGAEFLGHEQAGPASADDHDVHRGKRFHGSSSPRRIFACVTWARVAGLGGGGCASYLSFLLLLCFFGARKTTTWRRHTTPPWP